MREKLITHKRVGPKLLVVKESDFYAFMERGAVSAKPDKKKFGIASSLPKRHKYPRGGGEIDMKAIVARVTRRKTTS